MGRWSARFDKRPTRCHGCGKLLRQGSRVYREGLHSYCRDCGRQLDRAREDAARAKARDNVRREAPALPGGGGSAAAELRFADGGRYRGELQDGVMQGKGSYTFPNGDCYSGEFRDGRFQGRGAYTFADGEQHAGVFENDRLSGEGYCIFPDGGRIEGSFQQDLFLGGRGWRNYESGSYRGEFGRSAVMQGVGAFFPREGGLCLGEFSRDGFSGLGRRILPDGSVKEGEFRDFQLVREAPVPPELLERAAAAAGAKAPEPGRMDYPGGSWYQGEVCLGVPHGSGSVFSKNGSSYGGEFCWGELVRGSGRLQGRSGGVYEGQVGPGGRPQGRGLLRRSDGLVLEGEFSGGRPQGEVTEYPPEGPARKALYLGGRPLARRGWWEQLDSEDEDREGTNLWLMGEGLSQLGPEQLRGCPGLGTLLLADSVAVILPETFSNLYIRRLIIPEGVKEIGSGAFRGFGPSQLLAVEGELERFRPGWLDGFGGQLLGLQQLLEQNSPAEGRVVRRRMRFPGGAWFEGETVDGVMQGMGVYRFENGDRYEGEFRDGCCSGWGSCLFKGVGRYVGEFREDRCNGAGSMFYQGGELYRGEWQDGTRTGWGRYTYPDGETVEGRWSGGELVERGVCPQQLLRLCPETLE